MIVDDEAAITTIFERCLLRANYHVIASNHPHEALSYYQANHRKIDLVILDYNMPEMNGISLGEAMLRLNPSLKTIMISGMADHKLEQQISDAGLSRLMLKPIRTRELLEAVSETLSNP